MARSRSVTMPSSFFAPRSSQIGMEPTFSVFINLATRVTGSSGVQQVGFAVIASLHLIVVAPFEKSPIVHPEQLNCLYKIRTESPQERVARRNSRTSRGPPP